MKNRIIIPASAILIRDKLCKVTFNLKSIGYYEYVINYGGVYFIHNKILNTYYVGSTNNYWERFFHRGHNYRGLFNRNEFYITDSNINDFEFIILINSHKYNYKFMEERYINLLKSYSSKFGYNNNRTGRSFKDTGNCGGFWITNGIVDKLHYDIDNIPSGFKFGRMKNSNVCNFIEWYDKSLISRNYKSEKLTLIVNKAEFNQNVASKSNAIWSVICGLRKYYNIELILTTDGTKYKFMSKLKSKIDIINNYFDRKIEYNFDSSTSIINLSINKLELINLGVTGSRTNTDKNITNLLRILLNDYRCNLDIV